MSSDVTRVTINSDDTPPAPTTPAQPPRFASTARVIGGVVRTTVASSTDAFGTSQNTVTAHEHDLHRADTRDLHPTTGPMFTSPGGSRVLTASEITPAGIVTVGGITTNVAAAIHAGLLRQNDAGQYVSADGVTAAPPAGTEQEQQQEQQQQQQQSSAEPIEPLDPSAEAIMSSVVANLPQGIATAVSSELLHRRPIISGR
jgi:hypothetical protein